MVVYVHSSYNDEIGRRVDKRHGLEIATFRTDEMATNDVKIG